MNRPQAALLATGRSTFAWAEGRAYLDRARAALQSLGAGVSGPADLVEFAEGVAAAGFAPPEEALPVLFCATFADASVALAAFGRIPRPVVLWAVRDPAPPGDRLHLNSLCGANLAAHGLVREGVDVRLLYGDPEEAAVREALGRALAGDLRPVERGSREPLGPLAPATEVCAGLERLRGARLGVVGDVPTGFTSCEYDGAWLGSRLGLDVVEMPIGEAFRRIEAVPAERRESAVAGAADELADIRELDPREVDLFGAVTTAMADWAREERLAGLGLRCWPEFPTQLGVCPCSALGRLAAAGVATQCERDVNGGATMLLLRALGARDSYLADIVRVDEAANTATFWHCGLAPAGLAADPAHAHQDTHCNRGIGVAGNFALRPGRVTIARVGWLRGTTYRLFLTGGEALPGPNRFKGNSVDVRLDGDAAATVRTFVERGFEHHAVIAWAELRPQLRRAAKILDLELVEC